MTKAEAGQRGGNATVKRYGRKHMKEIAHKGTGRHIAMFILDPETHA